MFFLFFFFLNLKQKTNLSLIYLLGGMMLYNFVVVFLVKKKITGDKALLSCKHCEYLVTDSRANMKI